MSEEFDDQLAAAGADGIEARAADWFDRKHFWTWSDEDQARLDAWLAQSPAHEIAYWRLEGAWSRTERLAALRPARTARWRVPFALRIAATLVLTAAIAAGYWIKTPREQGAAYATKIGGHETIVISDGTRIELNTDSAVRVSYSAGERKIWLDKGEAYFQVVHDAARPLTVFAGDRRVTDIGTKFVVRRDSDQLNVAVVEGRVGFDAAAAQHDSRPLLLSKNDEVVVTASGMSVDRKTDHELANELSWRRGVIVFDATPLAEAAREINRYNSEKIAIADERLGRVAVTGTISANDPQQFVRMTQYLLGLRGSRANGEIVISR